MPLNIYSSNRMENLVEAIAGVVKRPLASPFTPEVIVVQSKGMQRWLSMELSRRFGVWANCWYPFPNAMVWRLFQSVLADLPDTSPYSPEVLTWRIAAILPRLLEREEFAQLRHYLAGDSDGLKLFQLSGKIADTFDQYTLFRPEMLLLWEEGSEAGWQQILWREIALPGENRHRAGISREFHRKIGGVAMPVEGIPERISLFGISSLPAFHLKAFAAVSDLIEVNLFILSPTREYWADIVSPRERAFRKAEERPFLIEGNPLLASLGKLGRDFSDLVVECGEVASGNLELYRDTDRSSLLRVIQSDILNLRGAEEVEEKVEIAAGDRSVQVHSCHSPMREMEVLLDNLLAMMDELPGLTPRDIVVMTPDIEGYAPYISAVFEGCRDPGHRLPFSIADRNLAGEGRIAPILLKLLGLPGSRLTVFQVMDILESPAVSRKFQLGEDDLEMIRRWLEETRVRWGLDAQDRARLGLPPYQENSWKAAVDRLILGYAMPDEEGRLFSGILPYDEIEGSRSRTLGNFLEFVSRISDIAARLTRPRSLSGWRDEIRDQLGRFFPADDDSARELASVMSIVERLGELEGEAGFSEEVELPVVRSWLSGRLTEEVQGLGFMTGGVTFCEMLPMRSIPFRVVALVGMNDGAFPRQARPPGFDLIASSPRRGDRSLRDEDRYLVLESLLSARDRFYVSHVGQSIKDNSEIPPSVLVSELLDYIRKGFSSPGGDPVKHVVTRHRLQAFSRDYFQEGSGLFSYSSENREALEERRRPSPKPGPFISVPLSPPPEEWKNVSLSRLIRFFDNPARFLLEERLGIRLEQAAKPLLDREPFALDGLDDYQLKQEMVECLLKGDDLDQLLTQVRCRGILPPAGHGRELFRRSAEGVAEFAEEVNGEIAGQSRLQPLTFETTLGGFTLSGRLDGIWSKGLLRYRCARTKAKDQVRIWIEHLVLNHLKASGYPRLSTLIMKDGARTFTAVEEPSPILLDLLRLYWEGLSLPLRFFPRSSMAYAQKLEWDLGRAGKEWERSFNGASGEGEDPYIDLCFRDADPFEGDFEKVAKTVLQPLIENMVED